MNPLAAFWIDLAVTLLAGFLLVAYLRPSLFRILIDLCGGEERARFWTSFSALVLIGVPAASALAYIPGGAGLDGWFFNITHRLSQNFVMFLMALVGLGFVVGFFALVAPRTPREKTS